MKAMSVGRALPVLTILLLGVLETPAWAEAETHRVSVSSNEAEGNEGSRDASISRDGRFVAFSSAASNLVDGDTNGARDVFVRDREAGTTKRVSASSGGTQGNKTSFGPAISADGRFIAFTSAASNLVPNDTNGVLDVFVHELSSAKTVRVSVSSSRAEANKPSFDPTLSPDGRFVAFTSSATNLSAKADKNRARDVFVRDRSEGTTSRVSVSWRETSSNGDSVGPAISNDGSIVAFTSGATNLNASGDTNRRTDVFLRDREKKTTIRVSVRWSGGQANGDSREAAVSGRGGLVAFTSGAKNLNASGDTNGRTDVFLRDRANKTTIRVSVNWKGNQSNGHSFAPAISADGGVVGFASEATNLIEGGDTNGRTDVFARDRSRRTTFRASVPDDERQANRASNDPGISADGRFVAFSSGATDLVSGDTNGHSDVFVRGPGP